MTNEIGTASYTALAPLARKEPVTPTAEPKKVSADQLVSGIAEDGQALNEQAPIQNRDELESTVQDLNNLAQELHRELRFAVDGDSGEMVVQVVDQETDKVVRQIPSEEIVQLRQRLADATGAIFRDSA